MVPAPDVYLERVYAGLLGKVIGLKDRRVEALIDAVADLPQFADDASLAL
jgi:hypothetical protein